MKIPKLGSLFDNNRFLQVFSVFVALLCWVGVQLTQSIDTKQEIQEVPVRLAVSNTTLTELGLTPVEGVENYVSVTVNGPRTLVGQLTAESFDVVASLPDISERGVYDLNLSLSSANQEALKEQGIEVVRFEPSTVKVRFDRMVTKTFELQADITGLSTLEDYMYEAPKVTPDQVTVTAPQADLDKIDRAVIREEFSEPLTKTYARDELPVVLLNAQGDEIDYNNRSLTLDVEHAQLTIKVLKVKTLPLVVGFTNVPSGFSLDDLQLLMEVTADEITLAGPVDQMDDYQEIKMGYINLKTISTTNSQYVFDLASELPADLININNLTSVVVDFDTSGWETAAFHVDDVVVENVPPGYEVTVLNSSLPSINMVGKKSVMESLASEDIIVTLDLSGKEISAGQTSYPVKVSVPTKGMAWALGDYSVLIQVSEKAPEA